PDFAWLGAFHWPCWVDLVVFGSGPALALRWARSVAAALIATVDALGEGKWRWLHAVSSRAGPEPCWPRGLHPFRFDCSCPAGQRRMRRGDRSLARRRHRG